MATANRRGEVYHQGDILEESRTGRIYVVNCATKTGLELLPGRLHPRFGYFVQDHIPVPVRTSFRPTGFKKIGVSVSYLPGAMSLK